MRPAVTRALARAAAVAVALAIAIAGTSSVAMAQQAPRAAAIDAADHGPARGAAAAPAHVARRMRNRIAATASVIASSTTATAAP